MPRAMSVMNIMSAMIDGLVLRPLCADDIDGVVAVEQSSFSVPWSRQSFEAELTNERAYYLVGELAGEIVAYMGMWLVLDEADVMNVAVLPKCRGMGIGTALVRLAIKTAAERGCAAMTLEVRSSNEAALALYTKLGFTAGGLRKNYYTNPREDAIIMWYRAK